MRVLVAATAGDQYVWNSDHFKILHRVLSILPVSRLCLDQEFKRGEVRWRAAGAVDDRVGRQSKLLQLSRRGNNVLETKQGSYAPQELLIVLQSLTLCVIYSV